jgi:hypothetical protein
MSHPLALLRTQFPHLHIVTRGQEATAGAGGLFYVAYENGTDGINDGAFVAQGRNVNELGHKLEELKNVSFQKPSA